MASKRQLKKFIRRSCGAFAAEILIARHTFNGISSEKVYDILRKLAQLQETTLSKANISYDHTPKGSDAAEYRKAKRAYYHKAYSKLIEEHMEGLDGILKEMNAALPEDVKAILKEAAQNN